MWVEIIGSAGFLLCFLYDINSITGDRGFLRKSFFAGIGLILCSTIGIFVRDWQKTEFSAVTLLSAAAGLLFAAALIYTLFFALPFSSTYVDPNEKRPVYSEGVYALCRHPGVLWFAGLYLCVAACMGTGNALCACLLLIAWDVLYVIFQDLIIFPKTFVDYDDYKETAPFLIPDRKSIKRWLNTWRKEGRRIESE